jgi:hypothetical protein
MGGFYDVTNLPTFKVNNPQVAIQQGVNDFRQYQTHQFGIQSAYPDITLTTEGTATAPGLTLSLDLVINGCQHIIRTPTNLDAFPDGTGAFVPSQVRRFYVNYLPSSLTSNTGTFYPSDYAVAANFGFKNNQGYRYYDANGVEVQTLQQSAESHLAGIPKNFGIGPTFDIGRGTEILLMWNDPYTAGQPLAARYLVRNSLDWISAGNNLAPLGDAYRANIAPFQSDPTPDRVILAPAQSLSPQWFY